MKVVVLGCGMIGSVIAVDFAESVDDVQITVADKSMERARDVASGIEGAEWDVLDSLDHSGLVRKFRGLDLVIGALPGEYGFTALRAAIEASVSMVDISFTPENPLELNAAARRQGVTIIPDCGVAPGLSNILVGHGASEFESVREAHILVGGLPEYPVPPLGYTITWSADGLIDEYMRDARIVKGGRIIQVPALSGLEEVDFPFVGRLEAFYTDGLRTLLSTYKGVESMWEKTLRYPKHVEKIELLRALGFFDEEPIIVEDVKVRPRAVTARLLERNLRRTDVGDILAMMVEVSGEKEGGEAMLKYSLLDRFDEKKKVSAMARTTGYTASIVAQKVAGGAVTQKGVVAPEVLGMDKALFNIISQELEKRGVRLKSEAA